MELRLKDIVFVPSVQHTGTWFVINFLKNFIPINKEVTFLLEKKIEAGQADSLYTMKYEDDLNQPTIIQIHLPIVRHLNFDVNFPDAPFYKNWIANLGTKRSLQVSTILLLCNFFKTVIPIRDPLAAILSREARHPQFRHFFIVDGFVNLAKEFSRHPNVKFFPIDLYKDFDSRKKLLFETLQHCGLEDFREEVVDDIAEKWPVENPTPGNRFKELYKNGDIEQIKSLLGAKCAELEYLKNMAAIILPFMADLGYTKQDLNLW